MQIVINIPEDLYEGIERRDGTLETEYVCDELMKAVDNGTPLPKGHGRLIDADKLKLTQHDIHVEAINYRHRCVSIENIDEAPTIIEAKRSDEE